MTQSDIKNTTTHKQVKQKSFLKKCLKWLFGLSLFIILVLFAILAGAANPILNAYLADLNQVMSQDLGRELKIKRVGASVFPSLNFELEELSIDQMLTVQSVDIEVDTLGALLSLGQKIKVQSATVSDLQINLVKSKEGAWNFETASQEIIHEKELKSKATDEQSKEVDKKVEEEIKPKQDFEGIKTLLKSLEVGEVHIKDLKVILVDQSQDDVKELKLAQIDLDFPLFHPAREIQLRLKALLLDQTEALEMQLNLGPYDDWLSQDMAQHQNNFSDQLDPPFPVSFRLNTQQLSLKTLKPYLAQELKVYSQISTHSEIELKLIPKKDILFKGQLKVDGIHVPGQAKSLQVQFHPDFSIQLKPTEQHIRLALGQTQLQANGMKLNLNGSIESAPHSLQLHGIAITSEGLTLERLLNLSPQITRALPKGSQLTGPLEVKLITQGTPDRPFVIFNLNLDQTALKIPQQFQKRAGTRLGFKSEVQLKPNLVELKLLEFAFGQAKFVHSGELQFGQAKMSAHIQSDLKGLDLAELSSYLPLVQKELETAKVKAEGRLSFESSLNFQHSLAGMKVDLDSALAIQNAQLNTSELKIMGSGGVKFAFKQQALDQFDALFDCNLSNLDLKFGQLFQKGRQVPFDIELEAQKKGEQFSFPQFNFQIADLKLRGQGQTSAGTYKLKAKLVPSSLKGALQLFGASRELGPDFHAAKLGFDLEITTGTNPTQDLDLKLSNFSFNAPQNQLSAQVLFSQPSQPKLNFKIDMPTFNLDRLFPVQATSTQSSQAHKSASTPSNSKVNQAEEALSYALAGSIHIKKGLARGLTFKEVNIDLQANNKEIHLKRGQVHLFGGDIRFHPLQIKQSQQGIESWSSELDIKQLDLTQVQKAFSKSSNMKGKVSGSLKVKGKGQDLNTMGDSLLGEGRIQLDRLEIKSLDMPQLIAQKLNKQIASKLKAIKPIKLKKTSFKMKSLDRSFKLKGSNIMFDEPLETQISGSPLKLSGALGLGGKLDFDTELLLSAKTVSTWLKKKITQPKQFPLKFKLKGNLFKPSVEGVAATALVTALVVAYGVSELVPTDLKKGLDQLKEKGKELEKQVKTQTKEIKQKAEQKLKEANEEAKKKAQELKDQAESKRKEAEAKAKAKAKKAKEKAKEALKGLF